MKRICCSGPCERVPGDDDFEGEALRVAEFLEIEVPEGAWPSIIRNCTLAEMRAATAEQGRLDAAARAHQ